MGANAEKLKVDDPTIVVYQSTDREGSTFSLSPDSRAALQKRFRDQVHIAPRIFIAHETRADFERIHGNLAKQLLSLLTGLADEFVAQMPVEFRDPVTDQAL